MNRQTQRYVNRMNNVVRALEEAPKVSEGDRYLLGSGFNMDIYGYKTDNICGSPGCAAGHYAFRRDLQKTFILNKEGNVEVRNDAEIDNWPAITEHFGITDQETYRLFDTDGCDNAGTDRYAAIEYIKNFIFSKWEVAA